MWFHHMNPPTRIVTPERRSDDVGDTALRPQLLSEFVGQAQARANLSIFIEAARKRGEALDHVLFVGPPGLGKTTLAQIVARELGVGFRATSGPVIAKAGALSFNSVTMRSATFGPTPGVRATMALSRIAMAEASSAGLSVPSTESATLAPTPCTVCNRRNHSRSTSVRKPNSLI